MEVVLFNTIADENLLSAIQSQIMFEEELMYLSFTTNKQSWSMMKKCRLEEQPTG